MKLWVLPLFGKGQEYLAVQHDSEQYTGSISDDNQWLVYESTDSGKSEIYVQHFPESGDRRQISLEGGGDPSSGPNSQKPQQQGRGPHR